MSQEITAALVQAAAPWFDLQAGMDKAAELSAQAAAKGATFVLFPEAFIGGYPRGLSFGTVVGNRSPAGRELWHVYSNSCPVEGGPEIAALGAIAKENQVHLAIGVVERARLGGSLYCSILYFSPAGELIGRHRKLKPTAAERLIWSDAAIEDSLTVVDCGFAKVGGLICWENYMPLARMSLFQQGVEIYLAPTADQRDRWQHSMIHIALEGRCFVLSANQFVTTDSIPAQLRESNSELAELKDPVCRGGSMIVSPQGDIVAGPIWDREEVLIHSIDLGEIQKAKMDFDVIGHYARSDAFVFEVANKKKQTDH